MHHALARVRLRTTRPAAAAGRRRAGRLFRHELRRILGLAGPIVLSQLGLVGMNTADTLMVGPLGANALAAAGIGSAIHMFGILVGTGIVLGTAPLISQAFGARDVATCRLVLVQGLWLSAALSVPVVWGSVEGRAIALALGQQPAVADLAGEYLIALAPGAPAALAFMAFRQYLEGMGLTRPAMLLTFLGLGVNVAANYVLIYGIDGWIPAMGVVGSGWSTTLVRWSMVAGMATFLVRRPGLNPFGGAALAPRADVLRRIARIGAPIGGQLGLEVGLFSLAAVMMGWFGATELASHQITINIASTTFMVALGTSMAGSIRVGHHVGAGNPRAVRRAALATYLLTVVFMAACAVGFVLVPEHLIGLYTTQPELVRLGTSLLVVAAAFQVFDGAQVAGLSVLRGAADTYVPMLAAAAGYWLFGLPAAYLLGFRSSLGPVGVWIGLCLALGLVAALLAWRVRHVVWAATGPAPHLEGNVAAAVATGTAGPAASAARRTGA